MAVISPTVVDLPHAKVITWASVTTSDSGKPVDISDCEPKVTIQAVGTNAAPSMNHGNVAGGGTMHAFGSALTHSTTTVVETTARYLGIASMGVATGTVTAVLRRRRI